MKILAIDSTALVASVALCDDEKLLALCTVNNGNTHSETLLPMVESALKQSKLSPSDIQLFAVSNGPGSFTGVRIGCATVKGLAFGRDIPTVGVSTLEALAYNLINADGIICPVMNARRNQVYNALFKSVNGELVRLCPDRAIAIKDLIDELNGKYPDEKVFLCGDGYDITLTALQKTKALNTPERARYQSAHSVASCALAHFEAGECVTDRELVATYLRPCQAERERMERLKAEAENKTN